MSGLTSEGMALRGHGSLGASRLRLLPVHHQLQGPSAAGCWWSLITFLSRVTTMACVKLCVPRCLPLLPHRGWTVRLTGGMRAELPRLPGGISEKLGVFQVTVKTWATYMWAGGPRRG